MSAELTPARLRLLEAFAALATEGVAATTNALTQAAGFRSLNSVAAKIPVLALHGLIEPVRGGVAKWRLSEKGRALLAVREARTRSGSDDA